MPDPRLRLVSAPVEGGVDDDLRRLMDDVLEAMYAAPNRVIAMDLARDGA